MKRKADRDELRLCWRHSLRLHWAAFGSLLDFTGRMYLERGRRVMDDVRSCDECLKRSGLT